MFYLAIVLKIKINNKRAMAKTDNKQNKDLVINQSIFEQIKEIDENGNEYWSARKLSKILD